MAVYDTKLHMFDEIWWNHMKWWSVEKDENVKQSVKGKGLDWLKDSGLGMGQYHS